MCSNLMESSGQHNCGWEIVALEQGNSYGRVMALQKSSELVDLDTGNRSGIKYCNLDFNNQCYIYNVQFDGRLGHPGT